MRGSGAAREAGHEQWPQTGRTGAPPARRRVRNVACLDSRRLLINADTVL